MLGVYANSDENSDKKEVSKFTSFGQKYNEKVGN